MIETFTKKEFRWLSNMFPVTIKVKGYTYASVEHAYQAQKSSDEAWKKLCTQNDISGKQIKVYSKTIDVRDDWDDVKLKVMEYCLRQKFKQEPFKKALILTKDHNIQEGNFWDDSWWGVDLKQNPNMGENHLGRLIMKIRNELLNK